MEIALRFATFALVHRLYNASEVGSMFPDFDALDAQGIRVCTVLESEIEPHWKTECEKVKFSPPVT